MQSGQHSTRTLYDWCWCWYSLALVSFITPYASSLILKFEARQHDLRGAAVNFIPLPISYPAMYICKPVVGTNNTAAARSSNIITIEKQVPFLPYNTTIMEGCWAWSGGGLCGSMAASTFNITTYPPLILINTARVCTIYITQAI